MRSAKRPFLAMACCLTVAAARESLAIGQGGPVKLSINVAGEYTDNRDSTEEGEDNFDFFLTPKIKAQFRAVQDRTVLSLFYAPSYRRRTDPSDIQNETEFQHDLGIEFKHKLQERWSLRATERFNLTDDPVVVDQGLTLRRDCSFTLNRAELETAYRIASGMDLSLLGQHWLKRYEEAAVAQESDEESFNGRLRIWQAILRDFGVLLDVTVEKWDYDSARGLDRDFTAWAGGIGLEKLIGAALKGSLQTGWKTLEYGDSELGGASAPYLQGRLRFSAPSEQIVFTVDGSYMLRDSDIYPYASQEYTGLGLNVEWRPVSRWEFGVGYAYRRGEYDVDMAPVEHTDPAYVRPGNGSEDVYSGNGSVAFNFDEQTSIRLVQSYEDRDTDLVAAWPYTRNATRMTFSKQF
ncbi:MAG: outer membrane beta-barrel protein [Verrucomicrobiota bacterium]|nr:outer membrane beta-barrel protein [Verrucomicrobiota bacterium]